MSSRTNSAGTLTGVFPIERSAYYQHWLEEHHAIDTHKYFLSEQVGKDVGWDYAQWDWIWRGHRARWLLSSKASATGVV